MMQQECNDKCKKTYTDATAEERLILTSLKMLGWHLYYFVELIKNKKKDELVTQELNLVGVSAITEVFLALSVTFMNKFCACDENIKESKKERAILEINNFMNHLPPDEVGDEIKELWENMRSIVKYNCTMVSNLSKDGNVNNKA